MAERAAAAGVGPGKVDWRALETKVVECLRLEHYSYRTEQAYLDWIRRYVEFHGWRKPSQLGAAEVTAFLKHLALCMQVASSTQNQALNAVVFLYKKAIKKDIGDFADFPRARKGLRLPVVASRAEVKAEAHFSIIGSRGRSPSILPQTGLFSRWRASGRPACRPAGPREPNEVGQEPSLSFRAESGGAAAPPDGVEESHAWPQGGGKRSLDCASLRSCLRLLTRDACLRADLPAGRQTHGRLDGTDVVARQEAAMGVWGPQVGGRDALEHAGASGFFPRQSTAFRRKLTRGFRRASDRTARLSPSPGRRLRGNFR